MPEKSDELGALWRKEGRRGEYWTGKIKIAHAEAASLADERGELAVVAFLDTDKRNERAPDVRLYISRPRSDQPDHRPASEQRRDAAAMQRPSRPATPDDLDDSIPF